MARMASSPLQRVWLMQAAVSLLSVIVAGNEGRYIEVTFTVDEGVTAGELLDMLVEAFGELSDAQWEAQRHRFSVTFEPYSILLSALVLQEKKRAIVSILEIDSGDANFDDTSLQAVIDILTDDNMNFGEFGAWIQFSECREDAGSMPICEAIVAPRDDVGTPSGGGVVTESGNGSQSISTTEIAVIAVAAIGGSLLILCLGMFAIHKLTKSERRDATATPPSSGTNDSGSIGATSPSPFPESDSGPNAPSTSPESDIGADATLAFTFQDSNKNVDATSASHFPDSNTAAVATSASPFPSRWSIVAMSPPHFPESDSGTGATSTPTVHHNNETRANSIGERALAVPMRHPPSAAEGVANPSEVALQMSEKASERAP